MKHILTLLAFVVLARYSSGGTVSYIRFEENGGSLARDETGLLDGDLISFTSNQKLPGGGDTYGAGWSTDTPCSTIPQTGEANTTSMRINGGSTFIDLSNSATLVLGYSFTLEMFIKPDELAAQYGAGIFGFGSDYTDQLFFRIISSSGNSSFTSLFMETRVSFPAEEIRFNAWQHVALVKDQGEYSVYLDGQLLHNEELSPTTDGPYEFHNPITGSRTIGDGFRGWIDEFRISDEALLPSQFLNATIPEPTTLGLLGLGLLSLLIRKRK
jgi:hypothetical protein